MKLLHKLILTFTVLAFLPLLLMTGVLLGSQKQRLMDIGREHVRILAVSTAERVDLLIERTVEQAEQLALSRQLVAELEAANAAYAGMDNQAVEALMFERDAEWQRAGGPEAPPVRARLENPAADQLRSFQRTAPRRYAEIMLTDRRGGLHAATNLTTDYYQADEHWWQVAWGEGRGATFVSDIGFDKSAGVFSLDVATAVRDASGEVVGVLKISHDVRALFEILRQLRVGETGAGRVVSSDGKTVFGGSGATGGLRFDTATMARMLKEGTGVFVGRPPGTEDDQVVGFALLRSTLPQLRPRQDGAQWFVVVSQDASEVYEPSRRALAWSVTVLLLPLAGLVLLAIYLKGRLVEPIRALYWASEQVAAGHLDARVQIEQGDEMQEVGYQFNRMAAALQRHEEEQRVEIRRRTEELRQSDIHSRRMREAISAQMSNISEGMLAALDEMRTAFEQGLGGERNAALAGDAWGKVRAYTEDLSDLCRVEAGQVRLQPEPVPLGDALDSARRVLAPLIKGHQVRLDIPDQVNDVTVTADRARLKQVLYSLLSNAVQYGGIGSTVTVRATRRDGETEVAVTDEGPGIPHESQEAIFDPIQGRSTPLPRTPEGRIGLNLPIVKRLVELQGGRIWVESEPGEGCTVRFTLPEAEPSAEEPQAGAP